jgi:hypothetical protein
VAAEQSSDFVVGYYLVYSMALTWFGSNTVSENLQKSVFGSPLASKWYTPAQKTTICNANTYSLYAL